MCYDWARALRDQVTEFPRYAGFYYKQGNGHRSNADAVLDGREWHEYPYHTPRALVVAQGGYYPGEGA